MSELMSLQDMANGHLDVKALGEAANGDENTIVTTRTGKTYPSAERAINIMFQNGGLPAKPFATKAKMTTEGASLADGQLAQVYNETANNGLYVKTAGNWVKSEYDPLEQARLVFSKKEDSKIYKGAIPSGMTALSSLTEPGYYYVTSSQMTVLTDKPEGFTSTTGFVEVTKLGDFVQQRIFPASLNLTDKVYYRKNTLSLLAVVTAGFWADESFGDSSFYKGRGTIALSETNPISSIRLGGSYLVTGVNEAQDKPIDYTEESGFIDVVVYGNFLMQTLSSAGFTSTKKWKRFIKISTDTIYGWTNISKSELTNSVANKKILFLGDSITANGIYPAKTAELLGATEIVIGVGGSDMTELTAPDPQVGLCGVDIALAINTNNYTVLEASPAYSINKAAVDRLKALEWSTVDYVVCFWGTNDYAHGKPIGVAAEKNRTSIKGAINYITDKLVSKYPHLKLIWLTPMYRSRIGSGDGKNSEDFPNKSGIWSTEYATAITTEASRLGTPSYNLYENGSINKYNSALYLSDGLHPSSPSGYNLLAGKVAAAISSNF